MNYDKVLNVKLGISFDFIPEEKISPEEYEKKFRNNVPTPPYKNPYSDDLAIFLYENKDLLVTILHYIQSYKCIDPVFVKGNLYFPMQFPLIKIINKFLWSVKRSHDKEIPDWKITLRLAIIKLSGNLYTSAGID